MDGSRLRGTAENLRSQLQPTGPSNRWTALFKSGRARHAPRLPRIDRLWQIIPWIHWPRRPAMAVETNLVDAIRIGFTFFANDDIVFRLQHDRAFRAKSASSIASRTLNGWRI